MVGWVREAMFSLSYSQDCEAKRQYPGDTTLKRSDFDFRCIKANERRQAMPQPICFMVMPYGKKETGAQTGKGPATIDFDSLWRKAFEPFIREKGYDPVRADQDNGEGTRCGTHFVSGNASLI